MPRMKINGLENSPFTKVCVIGLGYIGLPTAAVLASRKIHVVGVDINQQVIDTINRGEIHFKEPELDIVVHAAVSEGYLCATDQIEIADAFIIAVPTPFKEDHQPDLSYIEAAVKSLTGVLKSGDLVILESTSPVGTTEQIADWLAEARPDLTFPRTHQETSDIRIAYCPERVLPGNVLHELVHNDRIIGGMTPKCSKLAVQLYDLFVEGHCMTTNTRTAEMCKLTENSFRDVNIAFANELSMICDKLDIDAWEMIRLANHHPRVNILKPGPGVGGHCVAVDPWFIISRYPEYARLMKTARFVNENKENWVVEKVMTAVSELLQRMPEKKMYDITILCLGMTFKPNVEDLRESPAIRIIKTILSLHSGHVVIVEPNIKELPEEFVNRAELYSLEDGLKEADIILKLVDHHSFINLSDSILQKHCVIDTCASC